MDRLLCICNESKVMLNNSWDLHGFSCIVHEVIVSDLGTYESLGDVFLSGIILIIVRCFPFHLRHCHWCSRYVQVAVCLCLSEAGDTCTHTHVHTHMYTHTNQNYSHDRINLTDVKLHGYKSFEVLHVILVNILKSGNDDDTGIVAHMKKERLL